MCMNWRRPVNRHKAFILDFRDAFSSKTNKTIMSVKTGSMCVEKGPSNLRERERERDEAR